jgi:hypothetical protein
MTPSLESPPNTVVWGRDRDGLCAISDVRITVLTSHFTWHFKLDAQSIPYVRLDVETASGK